MLIVEKLGSLANDAIPVLVLTSDTVGCDDIVVAAAGVLVLPSAGSVGLLGVAAEFLQQPSPERYVRTFVGVSRVVFDREDDFVKLHLEAFPARAALSETSLGHAYMTPLPNQQAKQ